MGDLNSLCGREKSLKSLRLGDCTLLLSEVFW